MDISQFHDELIVSLQQISTSEAVTVPTVEKLQALKACFDKLGLKVRLSDETLNAVYDALEAAGFDLNPAY